MTRLSWAGRTAVLAWVSVAGGQSLKTSVDQLPEYKPRQHVAGAIRIWGHGSRNRDFVGPLIRYWEDGFRKYQPDVAFSTELLGNASAIGGLYTGAADIAFMGREIWAVEKDGYEQGLGYEPFGVSVANGSVANPDHDFALVIFVHRDNPLSKLSLTQLDAIFGADHKRGLRNIRKWGELGLTAEWAEKPIHLYGYGIDRDYSQFFERAVFADSRKWNCNLKEVADQHGTNGQTIAAGQAILDALAADRYGIAFSSLAYRNRMTKPLALAAADADKSYAASAETIVAGQYPLARTPYMFVNRTPKREMDPKVREFLLYVLSRQGQQAVLADGGYLPLSLQGLLQERERLLR